MSDEMPVFEIGTIMPVHLIFDCPNCGETHHHGNARELEIGETTHRAAHCEDSLSHYRLKRTERTTLRGDAK
jgi:hypothetical protein